MNVQLDLAGVTATVFGDTGTHFPEGRVYLSFDGHGFIAMSPEEARELSARLAIQADESEAHAAALRVELPEPAVRMPGILRGNEDLVPARAAA